MTEDAHKPIIHQAESAKSLLDYYRKGLISDYDKRHLFITLIHLERAMDDSRGLMPIGEVEKHRESLKKANKLLDNLRKEIWSLRESLPNEVVENILDELGEDFKERFRKI